MITVHFPSSSEIYTDPAFFLASYSTLKISFNVSLTAIFCFIFIGVPSFPISLHRPDRVKDSGAASLHVSGPGNPGYTQQEKRNSIKDSRPPCVTDRPQETRWRTTLGVLGIRRLTGSEERCETKS